jgi:hypothetical protein
MKMLYCITINKSEALLEDAITWLIQNYPQDFKLNNIEETENYYIIKQNNVPNNYVVTSKILVNEEYFIYFIYYDKNII